MVKFKTATLEATEKAIKYNKPMYVYLGGNGFFVSPDYWEDWLFRAYPSGKKGISEKGRHFESISSV